MGTRADFYVGRGESAEWLGSIAIDGYPARIPRLLLEAGIEEDFRARLKAFAYHRPDFTPPRLGWPWPWTDSRGTDYAYAFDGGRVWASEYGRAWGDPLRGLPDGPKVAVFPDMTARQKVTYGERSGLTVYGSPERKK